MELKRNTKTLRLETKLFVISLILSILIVRMLVSLFFTERTEVFRSISGLSFHHFHYGILLLMLSMFFMLFFKETKLIVIFAGVGNGLIIDSFIPSLLLKTDRVNEISAYNAGLFPTLVLVIVAVIIILFKNNLFRHTKPK
mgnify:CR=1 FL=1